MFSKPSIEGRISKKQLLSSLRYKINSHSFLTPQSQKISNVNKYRQAQTNLTLNSKDAKTMLMYNENLQIQIFNNENRLLGGMIQENFSNNQQSQIDDKKSAINQSIGQILSSPLPESILNVLQQLEKLPIPKLAPIKVYEHQQEIIFQVSTDEQTDLTLLVSLIKNGVAASLKLSGKDVVFLFGKTGAGKSTMIHFLSGIRIKNIAQKTTNSSTISKPKLTFQRQIQGFQVGHSASSMTKQIRPLETSEFTIVDTAGLTDTNGVYYDIANTIGLQKALHQSKSVKMLILIKQSTIFGDRAKQCIDFIQQLVGYVKDVTQFIPTATVLITHSSYTSQDLYQQLIKVQDVVDIKQDLKDPLQKQKIKKFFAAMIIGAKIQTKRQKVNQFKTKLIQNDKMIEKQKRIIQQEGLEKLAKKIEEHQQEIQKIKKQIQQKETDKGQRWKQRKLEQIDDLKGDIKKNTRKLEDKKEELKKSFEQIEIMTKYKQSLLEKLNFSQKQLKYDQLELRKDNIMLNDFKSFPYQKLEDSQQAKNLKQKLIKCQKIKDSKNTFQISIKNNLKSQTQNIVYTIQIALINTLKSKNYLQAKNYLEKIQYLNQYITTDTLTRSKTICFKHTQDSIISTCNFFRNALNDILSANGIITIDGLQCLKQNFFTISRAQDCTKMLPNIPKTQYNFKGLSNFIEKKFRVISEQILNSLKNQQNFSAAIYTVQKLETLYINFGDEVPVLKGIYENFAHEFQVILAKNLKNIRLSIQSGQYVNMLISLNFINQIKETAGKVFGYNLTEVYTELISQTNKSLEYRFEKGFTRLIEKLSSNNTKQIKQEYDQFNQLKENCSLIRHIGNEALNKCYTKAYELINQNCAKLISLSKQKINQKKFQELREPLMILKDLRKIDDKIASKTSQQYARFISRLELDITGKSTQVITDVMRKVKQGILEQNDIDQLKIIFDKLNRMSWLEAIMQKQGIKQIMDRANQSLMKQAKQISSTLQSTFYAEMQACQDYDINDDSSTEVSETGSITGKSMVLIPLNKRKFAKLNSSTNFIKKLSQINQQLSQCFNEIIQKLTSLIVNECKKYEQEVVKNHQNYQLHKIQIDRSIIKLSAFKCINFGPTHKVQECLKKICFLLGQYFDTGLKDVLSIPLKEDDKLINCASSQMRLFDSLNVCDFILRKKNIQKSLLSRTLNQKLSQRFDDLFQHIRDNLANQKFNQCKQSLQILRKYRNSVINNFLVNRLKERHEVFTEQLSIKVSQVPEHAKSLFDAGKYSDLIELYESYSKNGNQKGCRNIKSSILSSVQTTYHGLMDDLSQISSSDDSNLKMLNNTIRKFNQYNQLDKLIPSFNYVSKRQNVTQYIRQFYNDYQNEISTNIQKLNFKNIDDQINKVNKINTIMLRTITQQDYKLVKIDLKVKLDSQINKILNMKLENDFKKYFSYLEKLKIIDLQYGTQLREQFKNNIKKHIANLANQIKEEAIQQGNKLEDFNNLQQKLKRLKQQTSQYISSSSQYNDLIDLYRHIENHIKGFSQTCRSTDKYSTQYLDELKNDPQSYFKAVKQMKSEYQKINIKKDEALKQKNYKDLSLALKELQKFDKISKHLRLTGNNSIKQSIKTVKKHIITKCSILKDHLKRQIEGQIVSNSSEFTNLKEYLNIISFMDLDTDQEEKTKQDAKNFHKQVIQCIQKIIPKVTQKSSVFEFNYKLQRIAKHQIFLQILKGYTELMCTLNKMSLYSDEFAQVVRSVQSTNQYEKTLASSIRSLPLSIKQFWDGNQFRKICDTLLDVKKINSRQSMDAFKQLGQLVRSMLQSTGKDVLEKVQQRVFKGVNDNINKIGKAQDELKLIPGLVSSNPVYQRVINTIDKKIKRQIVDLALNKMNPKQAAGIVQNIIQLKEWVNNLPVLQKSADKHIKQIFNVAKIKKVTNYIAPGLRQISKDTENPIAATICGEILHKYQKQLSIPRILPKLTMTLEDIIKIFKGQKQDSINKQQLLSAYNIYIVQYDQLKQRFISMSQRERINENLLMVKQLAKESLHLIGEQGKITYDSRKNIPKLLARLFIYLSIMKSGESYYDALETSEAAGNYLLQPHPIQVLSILRFIGCDYKQTLIEKVVSVAKSFFINLNKLPNHLMQIKTGQGKSIILGTMSLLLALMGNEVSCVCYSSYLSERDYESFKDMFEAFDVQDKIHYGTFSQISQMIINQNGNVRELVSNLFSTDKKQVQFAKGAKTGNRVLLVDEVDTFFSKDFYGNTYNPCTIIRSPSVIQVIKQIWKNKLQNPSQISNLMKASASYKKVCSEYTDCVQKIQAQFRIMITDVKNYKSRDYVVQNGLIGYKQQDGLSFNSVYGYQTMFLYMHQFERGSVTEETLKQNMGISLSCGSFSYAQIVDRFDKIFGVSGTLENLNNFQENILKRYKIEAKTFAPSVYGDSRRDYKPILIEEGQGKHYQTIAGLINEGVKLKKSFLVFFENQNALMSFKQSKYSEHFREKMNIVTQKIYDRDFFIKKATSSQLVTLFTAPFGRGTDFVVFDPLVKQNGVDVIQTFLSQQLSQEIQMQGRTARQGSKGSYQLVLNLQKLQAKYKVTKDMISKAKESVEDSVTKLLQRKREEYLKVLNVDRQKNLVEAKKLHQTSMEKRNLILNKKIDRNDQFFFVSGSQGKARIMIMVDSTGSMGGTINAVKGKVMDMIEVLAKTYPNQFQIQIMFYYGDNSYTSQKTSPAWHGTNRLHISDWSSDVKNLKAFLATASANGGSGHEAIEVALHHLIKSNEQNGVKKALLIGDAGLDGRLDSSISYVVNPLDAHRYAPKQASGPIKLVFSDLLNQLKSKGVEVDTYPIANGQQIQLTCKQLSDTTNGKTKAFDPNKDNLAAELEATITSCIMMKK